MVNEMALRQSGHHALPVESDTTDPSDYELPPIRMLNREETRTFFDDKVRELLGISAEEFVERWHAGDYADILDNSPRSDIMYLTLLGNLGRSK
ncbi:MAG: hypothetical protein M3509_02905 [Chloroflexota bacterium]|nr:hypothetical protein [Chloroflexota bacterium]